MVWCNLHSIGQWPLGQSTIPLLLFRTQYWKGPTHTGVDTGRACYCLLGFQLYCFTVSSAARAKHACHCLCLYALLLLTIRMKLNVTDPFPAQTNAALWMGLNSAPPNMSHIGPIISSATTVTATASANSPMPLMSERASAACRRA